MTPRPSAVSVGLGLTALLAGYVWTTAFTPSRAPTREQIARNGGRACALEGQRVLEYFEFGNPDASRVLVALPGAQSTGNLFVFLNEWAKTRNVRIVAPSLPGFGLTPHHNGGLAQWVKDIETLLQTLKIHRFDLMGASLGSIYAEEFAATCDPEKFQILNICLYVAFAPTAPGEYDPLEGSILQPFGKLRNKPTVKRLLERLIFIPLLKTISPRDSDVCRSIRWQWEGVNSCADVIYAPRASVNDLADGGKRKVLIVSGTTDVNVAPHNQTRLHHAIAGSQLIVYEGGHERAIVEPSLMIEHLELLMF
ncbi:hypothetical protein HDU98_006763 [Podochytrium sp. JEL0797]|nr:hypothetical protein HDU98_006763 [Podochytrium sp. JEL0797]